MRMGKEEEKETKEPKKKPSLNSFLYNPRYRAKRKRNLLGYIQKQCKKNEKLEGNDGSLNREFVVGLFSFQWGISCRVVGTYLDELLSVGAVAQRGDRIKVTKIAETLLTEIPYTDRFE